MQHDHLANVPIFVSHEVCWLYRSDIVWTHAVGDGLTAVAYYLIPLFLFLATRHYHFDIRVKGLLWIYAGFILLCGTTHFVDLVMIWYVTENILIFDGWLRVVTGAFSLMSAGVTIYTVLRFLTFARRYLGLTAQMTSERREYDRITTETWNQFKALNHELRSQIYRDEQPQE
jgi:hypothetical protein